MRIVVAALLLAVPAAQAGRQHASLLDRHFGAIGLRVLW